MCIRDRVDVEEHLEIISFFIKISNNRVPIIAGTGANSTKEAIELTREAKDLGADAALLVSPYYNKPTQEGLFRHFTEIANQVDIPQIIYNVPSRTASNIDVNTDQETLYKSEHYWSKGCYWRFKSL